MNYLVQSRSFAEMLEASIRKYQNRTIEAAQVIAEWAMWTRWTVWAMWTRWTAWT